MKGIQIGAMQGAGFFPSGVLVHPSSPPAHLLTGHYVTYGGAKAAVCIRKSGLYTYFELRLMIDGLGETR